MRATARECQNDDEVPADRPGRQTRQVAGPEYASHYEIFYVEVRRLGDAVVTQPYAWRRGTAWGRVHTFLLPPTDFLESAGKGVKTSVVEPNGTKPVPLCGGWAVNVLLRGNRWRPAEQQKVEVMLGFVRVDLMCSFSPAAWRLDQLVIIAPLPISGIPSFHSTGPQFFHTIDTGFRGLINEFCDDSFGLVSPSPNS